MASVMTYRLAMREHLNPQVCLVLVPSAHNPSVCLFIYRVRIHEEKCIGFTASSTEYGVRSGKGRRPVRWTGAALEDGGLGRRGRSEGEGEWRPGLRPSRTLAGALLVGDVGEDGVFGWREAPTHRWRPAAEASDLVGLDRRLEARPSQQRRTAPW